MILLEDVDIDKILMIPSVVSSGEKNVNTGYVVGYKDDYYKMKPLPIILPKTSAYVKSCGGS